MKLLSILVSAAAVQAITVSVSGTGGKAVGMQYGLMFEDINNSGDGGVYAELIKNRAFQADSFTPATLAPWTAFGGATLTLQTTSPALSSALPRSVNVKGSANTEIGITNPGFWGIEVAPETYTGSFYSMGAYKGSFTAALRSNSSGAILASATIDSKSVAGAWTKHTFKLKPKASAGTANVFTLTYTPTSADESLNFGLISLFPKTYKNRPNGMRKDIMEALKGLNPSFFRIPGGNNLEGNAPPDFWNWTNTIGDLTQRPGRTGTWGYYNTDGLGLIEYMLWCQDLEVEPVLAVWGGMYLNGDLASQADIQTYVSLALNELEFLMGDATTAWGQKRIALGYHEPFPIKYVEVGNEDNLNNGQSSYNSYRFPAFYNGIKAKYPNITVVASTTALSPQPGDCALDYHQYTTPDIAAGEFHMFDSLTSAHQVMFGEFAVVQPNLEPNTDTNWNLPFKPFPFWIGAVAEAIVYLGTERNSDRMIGIAYAPLLENMNSIQWNPDMISFNADSSKITLSVSYHVVKLFSNNRFTSLLPLNNSANYGPAYWVAGVNEHTSTYVWKGAVYNTTSAQDFTVEFPGAKSGDSAELTVLTSRSGPYAMNAFEGPEVVNTTVSKITASAAGFSFSLPEWSVAVLSWDAGKKKVKARRV